MAITFLDNTDKKELQDQIDDLKNGVMDGEDGTDGEDGVGIASVVQTTKSAEDDGVNVVTVTLTDGKKSTFEVQNGSKGSAGSDGVGIASVEPVAGSGLDGAAQVIRVTLTDGTSSVFYVYNGSKGDPGADGKSAYSYAVDAGYTGTEEEFAAKLASSNTSNGDGGSVTVSGALFVTLDKATMTVSADSLSAMESAYTEGRPIYLVHDLIRSGDNTVLPFVHRTNMSSGTVLWVFSEIVHQGTESATPNLDVIRVYGDTGSAKRMVYGEIALKSDIPTGGGSGGTTVQSDYLQNDPTASDYIKNRPFYEEITVLLPETEIPFTDGSYIQEGYTGEEFVVGETYIVTWNGTEYTCVAQDVPDMGGTAVGNIGLAMGGADTGEPFVIGTSASQGVFMVAALDGSTSAVIKISGNTIKKIDEKFLPEVSVYYVPVTKGTDDSGNVVYSSDITIDEMGKAIDSGKRVVARLTYEQNGVSWLDDYQFASAMGGMGIYSQVIFASIDMLARPTILKFGVDDAEEGKYSVSQTTRTN